MHRTAQVDTSGAAGGDRNLRCTTFPVSKETQRLRHIGWHRSQGNLYGTNGFRGSTACYLGYGTIFELAPSSGGGAWRETVLRDLGVSGQNSSSSIVQFHSGFETTTSVGLKMSVRFSLWFRNAYGSAAQTLDGQGGSGIP